MLSLISLQESQKNGDPTESVAKLTPYLTAHMLSVILTGINRVVIGMASVVPLFGLQIIVLVKIVRTTNYSKTGMNQMEH